MHTPPKWSNELKQFLEKFLSEPERPPNTLNYYQLDGFVRSASLVPEFQSMFNWSPAVFCNKPPNFKGIEDSRSYYDAFFALNNHHVEEIIEGKCSFPVKPTYHPSAAKRKNLEDWCKGFLLGYEVFKETWVDFITEYPNAEVDSEFQLEPLSDELETILHIVNTVADSEAAVKNGTDPSDLEGIFDSLEESILFCGAISKALIQADDEVQPSNIPVDPDDQLVDYDPAPFVRKQQKIGRNSACPCGSGKKFKKCCLH